MSAIGVGVIGVGYMGALHARAYAAEPRARLVGVFDSKANAARSVASMADTTTFNSLDEMLSQKDVEAVSICTPDAHHVEPTLAALNVNKHVLLEKPIATSAREVPSPAEIPM